jgi:hypothetical protein
LTALTFTVTVAVASFGSATPLLVPSSRSVYVKLAVPLKFGSGVNETVPAASDTTPFTAPPTPVTVRVCPLSSAGPGESLAASSAAGNVTVVSSAVAFASATAVGLSLTAVTVIVTVARLESRVPSLAR